MKYLRQGAALALLGAGLAAVPGIQASAAGTPGAAGTLVQQMRESAAGSVAVSTEPATGKIGFIRAKGGGDLLPSRAATSADGAVAKADAYLAKYAGAFGARPGELRQDRITRTAAGWTVTYAQVYRGVPVFGAMLKANVDEAGDLVSVNGFAAPDLSLSVTPRFNAGQAGQRAVAIVRADRPGAEGDADVRGIKAVQPTLVVYRLGSVRGETGRSVLAWKVEVTNGRNVRDTVLIDANTLKPVNRYSMVDDALNRQLDEAYVDDNGTPDDPNDDFVAFDTVWQEGDSLDSLNQDQKNLVNTTGDSYWIYNNAFGRDSYDGNGSLMRVVNNDPRISCPNANWNGVTTNYCDGVTSDDVVAHEWGHAYTEYTSGLIYQWQSGALNESYSDMWGETVDLINGRDDEGETTQPRSDGLCSSHSSPKPQLTITSPESIAKQCLTGGYFGPDPLVPVQGDVVAPTDADEDGDSTNPAATTLDGCSAYDQDVTGKIVLVNRGFCFFTDKAQVAKDAGAAALIIGNRDNSPVSFSDADQSFPTTVSIGLDDRESIRNTLANNEPVSASITDAGGAREDSYRWLIGEKSEAFGGAIRDMWNPNCYGDPGKVSDAQYTCSTSDSGGVHQNSGVPNHAYALLTDGGTYNGVTVQGIGLDKAANLIWQTQTSYLTPTSDFTDFADGMAAACEALTGQDIRSMTTTPDAPGELADPITTADCVQVAAVAVATELRKDPTQQCNFQPILDKDTPALCGEGTTTKTVWNETFDKGLGDWTKGFAFGPGGGRHFPWKSSVGPERDNLAAFAPDPQGGSCGGDANDYSSADFLTSPRITMPKQAGERRLAFDHNVATELGYDGGNVKIKVGKGKFETVPAEAFDFNPYNDQIISAEEGNSNPLQGQPGFTGTDGGKSTGSWGTSYIDLKQVGVGKGDQFQVRFAFGRDGCGGNVGWYVDNVAVVLCKTAAAGLTGRKNG